MGMFKGNGCLWCVVLYFAIPILFAFCIVAKMEAESFSSRRKHAKENEARQIQERAVEEREQRKEAEKESKLRAFALKNASGLWQTYQALANEIKVQNQRISDLRKAFAEFNRNPDGDADYKRVCALRDEMVKSLDVMRTRIEDSYLASLKFEATPGKTEYAEIMRKALEEGIREASAVGQKFKEMKEDK